MLVTRKYPLVLGHFYFESMKYGMCQMRLLIKLKPLAKWFFNEMHKVFLNNRVFTAVCLIMWCQKLNYMQLQTCRWLRSWLQWTPHSTCSNYIRKTDSCVWLLKDAQAHTPFPLVKLMYFFSNTCNLKCIQKPEMLMCVQLVTGLRNILFLLLIFGS